MKISGRNFGDMKLDDIVTLGGTIGRFRETRCRTVGCRAHYARELLSPRSFGSVQEKEDRCTLRAMVAATTNVTAREHRLTWFLFFYEHDAKPGNEECRPWNVRASERLLSLTVEHD